MFQTPAMCRDDYDEEWIGVALSRLVIPADRSGCWDCKGIHSGSGYPIARARGSRRTVLLHRLVYCTEVGPISAGFVIDHLCENPRCCNPSHLQMTTQRNNLLRTARTQAGCNARKPMCPKCGGPWSERTKVDGRFRGRYCKPCFNEYKRGKLPEYRAKNAAYKKAYRARAGAA